MRINIFLFSLICLFAFNLNSYAQTSLAAGTQITMADDSEKDIEKVVAGDKVLVFNTNENVYEEREVKSVNKVMMNRLIRVTLETGMQLTMTIDYPVWAEKGWVSVDPNLTVTNKKYTEVQRCNIGDFILYYNITSTDYVEVSVIQGILDPTQTYTLELDGDGAIVANGFLVGQI